MPDDSKRRKQLDDAIEGRSKAKEPVPIEETEEERRQRESEERVEEMLRRARERQNTDSNN